MFRVPIFLCILLFSVLILDVAGFGLSPFSVNGEVSLRKGLQTSRSARMKMAISTLEDSKPRMGRAEGISSTKPPLGIWEFATNWHWGVQDPGIPLPIKVVEGQPPELCTVVTQEHLNTLARDGVVLIKGVLNKSWIEYLRRIIDWQVSHPHVLALAGVISNLYDYVQRCAWRTNPGFADFLYYSPVASALGQLAGCGWFPDGDRRGHHEIRISTDLLLVNPNKGFQWHQDEQNGPLTAGRGSERLDALRYWITVDDTRADFGAPVYLKGSQENDFVDRDVVFVDMEANGVLARYEATTFQPEAGDMIVWHPKVIHKVDGAPRGWGDGLRRVLAGTAAVDDCRYQANEEHALGRHGLRHGDPLRSPYFPIIYPRSDPAERADLRSGEVGRSGDLYARLWHTMRWYLEGLILKTPPEAIQARMRGVPVKARPGTDHPWKAR